MLKPAFDWAAMESCLLVSSWLQGAYCPKKTQDERLIKWIADDQQSLSVVEDRSFKSFVKCINPNYTIPTKKTITRQIVNTYATHLDVLKSQLDSLDAKVSLTYDVWTSKANLPYASITAHFIDNDWNAQL
ncbi:hypothetical protein V1520DRAFT_57915 [Lipomyces starkeyi]